MSSTYGSRLDGVMVLVTGASSGIGRAVAKYLGEAGASVAINYHMQREAAEMLARELRESGGSAVALGGDVSRESDVITLFDNVVREFGRLDVLIANSGMQRDAPVADMTLEDRNAVIEVDLTAAFLCCRQAVRQFRTQPAEARPFRSSGSIIAITSVHDRIPWAGHSNYTASKGGARMFVKTLAQEVAGDGIRVNAIAPGAIRTSINRNVWDDKTELEKAVTADPVRS